MGAVPGIHHVLLSSALISLVAAVFLHEADNFQTQIKGCLPAPRVLQSWLRTLLNTVMTVQSPSFPPLPPPSSVLGDSNCLGVSQVLPVLS